MDIYQHILVNSKDLTPYIPTMVVKQPIHYQTTY